MKRLFLLMFASLAVLVMAGTAGASAEDFSFIKIGPGWQCGS
jgi:hypothetical protein